MIDERSRETLRRTISSARKRIFLQSTILTLARMGLAALPVGAVLIATNQRWLEGRWTVTLALATICFCLTIPVVVAALRLGTPFRSALTLDEHASLKDRISSAWEFLAQDKLDGPRVAQVQDAVEHAHRVNLKSVFHPAFPRTYLLFPLAVLVFLMSFFVPSKFDGPVVEASVDPQRLMQLEELRSLQEELAMTAEEEEDAAEVLEKLREIEDKFEKGDLSERDMMIELARLDESLRQKMAETGLERLDGEVKLLVPQLMSSQSSRAVAQALKENQFDKAAAEMERMAAKFEKGEISASEKEKLALNMGVAGSKLGSNSSGSFGGDFSEASKALESGDSKSFKGSSQSIGKKFKNVGKYRNLKKMRSRIALGKAGMGKAGDKPCKACGGQGCEQCAGKNACALCNGAGCSVCGEGGKKGGLMAGTASSGNPEAKGSRLSDSYRKMLRVTGAAGEGPVDSEVEITEGQLTDSRVAVRDLYAEYAAVAEQAIDREEIPLSHRFHVKRYFQAIRPED